MVEDAGRPDILLADIRPISYAILIVSSHVVAEQISKVSKLFPTSTPKSPTIHDFTRLIGHESLLGKSVSNFCHLQIMDALYHLAIRSNLQLRAKLGNHSARLSTLDFRPNI